VQPEEVEPLVEGLRDPVPWARWCAAIALGHAGDARAVPVLCHALPQAAGLDAASALALQEVLGALERIVQVRPVPGLRVALPTLRRFESSVLAHSRVNRSRCRALIRRIEAATDPVYDLPLPGRAAGVHYGELPQPASPGERGAASRPVPWEGGEPPEGRAGSLSLAAFLRSLLDRWRALRHPAA